jgi:inosine-uridine nucleoside N-ribohydrolase
MNPKWLLTVLGVCVWQILGAQPIRSEEPALVPSTHTLVWIDTDPSVEPGGHEVDDGLALIQAFHSPELIIRGISVVFGNAQLEKAVPIGREIVRQFAQGSLTVYPGASGAQQLGRPTEAARQLAEALRHERLTILALGPLTNVATVLVMHPELRDRIIRVIAVAGRRPGQQFLVGTGNHKPFRDFNFELDPQAFGVVLQASVPLTLAPWELSSQVWLTREDLDHLNAKNPALEWLVRPARDWLTLWQRQFGVEGFNPFDTLAVAAVTSAPMLECEHLPARITTVKDDAFMGKESEPTNTSYLEVSKTLSSPYSVRYCFRVDGSFKRDLLTRLTQMSSSHP